MVLAWLWAMAFRLALRATGPTPCWARSWLMRSRRWATGAASPLAGVSGTATAVTKTRGIRHAELSARHQTFRRRVGNSFRPPVIPLQTSEPYCRAFRPVTRRASLRFAARCLGALALLLWHTGCLPPQVFRSCYVPPRACGQSPPEKRTRRYSAPPSAAEGSVRMSTRPNYIGGS